VVAGGAFVVGLAALLASRETPASSSPPLRVVVRLPDSVLAAVVACFALAVFLLLALWSPRGLRRRRKHDDEFELYYEPPRVSPWILVLLWLLALLPFAAAGYLLWLGWSPLHEGGPLQPPFLGPALQAPAVSDTPTGPPASVPLLDGAVVVLALLTGLASLGLMAWIYFGDRLARWWAGPFSAGTPERLSEAIEESLDDLRREPDPRRAIIQCYRRFEHSLARSNVARAPWQTPLEFMRAALNRLPLPADAVQSLTDLFQVSRFSDHPIGFSERDLACEYLGQIKAALERSADRVPAA
jgi:hypothetical protein